MWAEPLSADTTVIGSHTVAVTAFAADGTPVARVLCAHSGRGAGCGVFGEMRVLDAAGAPAQRARALVLLVREALRYAASIGVTHVETEAPARLWPFAARISGLTHRAGLFAGDLHAVRSHVLQFSDAAGNEISEV